MKDFNLEGKTLVGLHPGSAWPTKCWPKEYFVELISRLETELHVQTVIVGGGKKMRTWAKNLPIIARPLRQLVR